MWLRFVGTRSLSQFAHFMVVTVHFVVQGQKHLPFIRQTARLTASELWNLLWPVSITDAAPSWITVSRPILTVLTANLSHSTVLELRFSISGVWGTPFGLAIEGLCSNPIAAPTDTIRRHLPSLHFSRTPHFRAMGLLDTNSAVRCAGSGAMRPRSITGSEIQFHEHWPVR